MRFLFKARTHDGALREGIVEAVNRAAAVAVLQRERLIPISVRAQRQHGKLFGDLHRAWSGLSQKELSVFFRELAALVHAKVPIVQALRAIEHQTDNSFLRTIVRDIAADVEDGVPLSEGLAKYPDVFSTLIVSVIRAGELSGNLQNAIGFVAESLRKSYQLTSRIRGALVYPAFVVSAALIIGFFTVSFILPNLTQVIRDFNIPNVPWYTTAVMRLGDFMAAYWWAVLLVLAAIIGAVWYYVNTPAGRQEWDHMKVKLPVFGRLFRMIAMARFAQNFALLMRGGIPVVQALQTTASVVDNDVYKGILLEAADNVRGGGTISEVFFRYSEAIPPMVARMIKIGEETGKMDETMASVGDFYEEEIGVMTRTLTTILEPVLIIFLGLGVAVLVFAILMPIYNIAQQL